MRATPPRAHLARSIHAHHTAHGVSAAAPSEPPRRFFSACYGLTGAYWTDRGQWRPRLLVAALALLVMAQAALAIRLNVWSADLFDALERRDTEHAMAQVVIFLAILMGMMLANTLHVLVRRQWQLDWRRWLTRRVLRHWMAEGRHYQAALIPGEHANPDGRIAEDIRIAVEHTVDMASSLLYSTLLLFAFVGILWSLSGWVMLGGVAVPGHLVLLAFGYAGIGAAIAFMLGRPLVRATDARQTREADFRFSLAVVREAGEPIAIARAEATERRRLRAVFAAMLPSWWQQTVGLARLAAFSAVHGALAGVLPLLVGTPRFLDGTLSLGRLIQSAAAFQQVTNALSWPVENLARIAEWRASVERILALEEAVETVAQEAARRGETAINLDRTPGSWIGAQALSVAAPDGTAMLPPLTLWVEPGEHILVDGDAEAMDTLFRVLAGIWPWGRGMLDLPDEASIMAMGARPFLPEGQLRDALSFPLGPAAHDDAALAAVLDCVELAPLIARLDESADWSRVLGAAELQRIAFARLLLHRPAWIVLGHATDALGQDHANHMLRLLTTALPKAGIVLIGRHEGSDAIFSRRLTLVRSADGEILLNEVYARRQAARRPKPRALPLVDKLREGFGP